MGEIFAGRYELVDPIGRGGVGAVWRAWDHRRRRYVAAKVLQQSDAHTLLRFVREQALRIDHPHVLAPASWAADDDKVLFTMDLVHGGSLAHLTGDYGPLPPRMVCTLMDQLLAGLTAVHAEGVVHRDIKPANILLEATGTGRPHLRLSDFGIAMRKGEPRLTETNYVVGTPGYFAPEQMLGAEPDFPADLFAAGLVALSLITGAKPDTEALVRRFAEHGVPNAPDDVPEPLWQVLASLLHPDPEARFKTATGARKALLAAAELLPEATIEDEVIEVFDHIGPLPAGFAPDGPLRGAPGGDATGSTTVAAAGTTEPTDSGGRPATGPASFSDTGSFPLAPPEPPVPPQPSTPPPPAPPTTAPPLGTPPRGTVPAPPTTPPRTPPPVPVSVPVPAPMPRYEPTAAARPEASATRPYTAGQPPLPAQPPTGGVGVPAAPPPSGPVRKPGPPPRVAVPVLIVALLCIAVGVWALFAG
ncbi:serine/threonine-protein kinase [Streptomyces sp. NPDC059152]|uniref:serine/threonine-protein kinase n=1 Tax=Streptomyces sp. NPDC059152 TaxID=3346742 RepID=UPI0036B88F95